MIAMRREAQPALRAISRPRLFPMAFVMLLAPAVALSLAAAGAGALSGDITATLLLQDHVPSEMTALFETVNAIGDTPAAGVVTLAIGLIALALRQPFAAAMILLTFPLRVSNVLLKLIIESPRPTEAAVSVIESADGFGFPSGHAMGATLLYGMLFLVAPRLTARRSVQLGIQVAALAMIVLVGVSRIYVGAHWPSDVVGGYLWASILLLAMILVARRFSDRRRAA